MELEKYLKEETSYLLDHECTTISKDKINLPGPDFTYRIMAPSDRSNRVLGSLQQLFDNGRLAGTGHLSLLPKITPL